MQSLLSTILFQLLTISLHATNIEFDAYDFFDHNRISDTSSCDRINIPICQKMPWNTTTFPNLLNHRNVHEAMTFIKSRPISTLLASNCTPSIEEYVCSFVAPFCSNGKIISPCKSFCRTVSETCRLDQTKMECDSLSNVEPCLKAMYRSSSHVICTSPASDDYNLYLPFNTILDKCGLPCQLAFTDRWLTINPARIRNFLAGLSLLCLLMCTFTALTFVVDTKRFHYPERSIIYICICFIPVATCYLIVNLQAIINQQLSTCDSNGILAQGFRHVPCILLFLFTYIPWLSSTVWFVILSFTWFLAAVLKWSHEAIEQYCIYFHLIAWISPSLLAVCALGLGTLAADPVSGLCMPYRSSTAIKAFLSAPHMIYLLLGAIFLLAGFVSLFKTRNMMKFEGKKTDQLEKLMFRIGLFALLYLIPSLVNCAGNYHKQLTLDKSIVWFVCQQQELRSNVRCPGNLLQMAERPHLEVAALKEVMFLGVGVVVSLWVWCPKTILSWKVFITSVFRCRRRRMYNASV